MNMSFRRVFEEKSLLTRNFRGFPHFVSNGKWAKWQSSFFINTLAPFLILIIFIFISACTLVGGNIVIFDGEEKLIIPGEFETVAEALTAAGISLRPEDGVTPAITSTLAANGDIHIHRAQPITLRTEQGTQAVWTRQTTLGAFLVEKGIAVQSGTPIAADGRSLGIGQIAETPLPSVVEIGRFHTVTIYNNNQQQTVRTAVHTVGEAVQEAGIMLFDADRIEPDPITPLRADMIINIQHSMIFTIEADGRSQQTRSYQTNPHAVLAEAGISLHGQDYTIPGTNTPLRANDTIQVIRVTEDFRLDDQPIPYQTIWQASDQLDLDSQDIIIPGVPGILRRRLRVRYENGVEVGQTFDGEWVEREPTNEVIGYGTRITIRTLNTPDGPLSYWRVVRMRVTSYTAASSGRELDDPAYGITASGHVAAKGIVAVDRSIVPFRSHVYVPNYGIGFVGDTGGGVRGRWIDLGYSEDDFIPWSGYTDVYYLTPVPEPEDINYLLPTVLP